MKQHSKLIWTLVLGLFLVILLFGPIVAASPPAQQPTRFRSILVNHDADIDGDLDVDGTTNLDAVDIDGAVDFATTLNVDGAVTFNSTLDVDGNLTSGTGAFTVADVVLIDGAANAIQLTVQGYTTQTTNLLTLEQSDGTDVVTVTNAGNLFTTGTFDADGAATLNSTLDVDGNLSSGTGAFTIADNTLIDGASDAIQLTVQGYTTQTTSLLVLEQSDGTDVTTVSNAGNTDVAGTLQFGADDNYALGYASSAQEVACFASSITGTRSLAATGLTTATFVIATLITDPGAGAGAPFIVSADAPTTSTVIINVWQDDATAATSVATVHWCAYGDE